MKRIIIIIGIQGSGNGTQANILAKKHHIPIVEAGELIRNEIYQNTKIGVKVKPYTNSGKMIPDRLFSKIVFNHIKKIGHPHNIIFDGFPRRMKQFNIISKIKKLLKMDEIITIYINLSETIAMKRISERLICPKCENTFIESQNKVNKCNKCNVELLKRSDDNINAIKKRFNNFKKQTIPVIKKLSKKGLILEFDGSLSVKTLSQLIDKSIKKFLKT